MKVGELFFGLGFDVDQIKLNDIVQSIGKLNLNSVLASVGVAGLVDSLKNVMDIGQQLTEPLYQFNKETGLSAQKMQQWSEYAQKFGVKADVVGNSLSGIQRKMAAMKFGDSSLLSGIYLLQQAGAKISQADLSDPFTFLEKARAGLQKINPELKTYVAGLLGLDNQILLVKDTFDNSKDLPAPTIEQINKIRDYTSAWTMLGINIKQVITDIDADLAPGLTNFGNNLNDLMTKLHEDSAKLGTIFESLIGIVALFLGPIGQVAFILGMIATHVKDIQNAGGAIGTWLGKTLGQEGINKGVSLKNHLNDAFDSFIYKNTGFVTPNSSLATSGISGGGGHQVTQQNTITIIAHNIEDIEHKFVAFMEKTIAKSFYQNSSNY